MLPNDNHDSNHLELDTTNFQTLLSSDDNNLQQALDDLDKHTHTGGGGTWGSITGTLASQTDLQAALDALTAAIAAKQNALGFTPRTTLAADANYYVRTDGNDSHDGSANDATHAFLTIQKAINVVYGTLDLNGHNVTIHVADGSYGAVSVTSPQVGAGTIQLTGNTTTPANCVISAAPGVYVNNYAILNLGGFKVLSTSAGISASGGAIININGLMEYGTCSTMHIIALAGAQIYITANYKISGASNNHLYSGTGGLIEYNTLTITITGTPAFSTAFAAVDSTGMIRNWSCTFSGAATGKRYSASLNGVINTFGGGATYFPGNAAGTTPTGGQYA